MVKVIYKKGKKYLIVDRRQYGHFRCITIFKGTYPASNTSKKVANVMKKD